MVQLLQLLDRILRGDATRISELREGRVAIPLSLSFLLAVLGSLYGFFMGWYALFNWEKQAYLQLIASSLKVPALFFLTLIVTFPSLYVFNALVGSRLNVLGVLRLLIASLGVTMAVLASFGPIVAFFSVSTSTYSFMVLLNVALFAIAGLFGLYFLLLTLDRITVAGAQDLPLVVPGQKGPEGALDPIEGHIMGSKVKAVFQCWIILFGLVGAQMGWVLRPFIGNPAEAFAWFRVRDSNFFLAIANAIESLLR